MKDESYIQEIEVLLRDKNINLNEKHNELKTFVEEHKKTLRLLYKILKISDKLQAEENKKNKLLEKLSITDQLTKLYNRFKIDEVFGTEVTQAKRNNTPLSVIMIDLDHFKSVNDTYGHQVGDEVLKVFAKILKKQSRQTDIVGRWGGEEFIIIAPNTNPKTAQKFANKLRMTIENYSFKQVGKKTASFGISNYINGDTQKSMIKRADNALYQAKKDGRNQVVCTK